ncbi:MULTISPECIES: TetR/AcrR family transcriptional regulator [unclassified Streptomyces]|uniref:TetR/AcrR family transcriptional regulator n=1 Tax=unclassified Streptomyces TaxID=2593676 RepID=UPI003D00C4DC
MSGKARVRARRMPRAERERQMLDAAVRVIGRRGYQAASMDEIAEAAGVSKPLVYLYLHSKEALFTACVEREARTLIAAISEAVSQRDPADRQLWSGLLAFFRYADERADGWRLLHIQSRTHGEPFAGLADTMRARVLGFVTALLTRATRASDGAGDLGEHELTGLAHALVGAAESLATRAADDPALTPTASARTLMDFAWTGLGGLMAGERWGER